MTNWMGWAGFAGSAVLALVAGCGGGGSGSVPPPPVNAITGVTVSPLTATVTIGTTAQFSATVSGTGTFATTVTWSVAGPSGWTGSVGSVDKTGLYESPFPAPATVTVTATATGDATKSGSATVTLAAPATAAGPALTVDAGNETRAISPLIYGANGWQLDAASAAAANFTVLRWGGDATSRYNYKLNTTNSASDWHFENFTGQNGAYPNPGTTANFTDFVKATDAAGMAALGTVPVQGWVSNSSTGNSGSSPACSFPQSTYPNQQNYDGECGNGVCPQGATCGTVTCTSSGGCSLYGNAQTPSITSIQATAPACTMTSLSSGCANGVATCMVQTCTQAAMPTPAGATQSWADATWAGGWVNSFVQSPSYGTGASGKGVALWDLDNEPAWWDGVHRDVHPNPSTYDEVTWGGISTAVAIKTADPTAEVSGPVIDYWWNYFYSKQDIENGWGNGPCYEPWDHPTDRAAHGGVPMIEYYLQQFKAAETTYGKRLLDYVDIHGYFAADYPAGSGNGVGLTTAGDTAEQQVRLNSTRALWDPTYTNANYPQPNYTTDANYTASCSTPLQAPQVIPMLHAWVNGTAPLGDPNNNYPGTKTAIDEYNFGGLEHINGALAQADVLGIFGEYGLDLATLWPTTQYANQGPGNMAFAIYRNYDGAKSTFGDMALASTSANPGQLSVYGALRKSDQSVTVVVINKTFGALTGTLSLKNLTATGNAQVFQYSAANLAAIVALPPVAVTPPVSGTSTSTISASFPASSISLFVIPTQ